jgi:hypothetical protein
VFPTHLARAYWNGVFGEGGVDVGGATDIPFVPPVRVLVRSLNPFERISRGVVLRISTSLTLVIGK